MKLDVPHYSQFVDIQDPFWILRACGGVALKEVAQYYGKDVPDLLSLCNEAKERAGYHMENGWVHDYLITKAKEFGLNAYRKEGLTTLDEIVAFIKDGKPVIVSVEKRVLEQKRFHLLVLVGYEEQDGAIRTFYYHESETTDKEKGAYRSCDTATFLDYWRGKALFISN